MAIDFFFFVYSAVFISKQRFDLVNLVNIGVRVSYALGVFALLSQGFGLVGLVLWAAATNLAGCLLRLRIAHRILPQLSLSFGFDNIRRLKRLAAFGGWSFVVTTSRRLISQTDVLVIAVFLGNAPIAPYYLAVRIAQEFTSVFVAIGSVLFPFFAQLAATDSGARIREAYQRGTRLVSALAIAAGTVAFVWSESFFRLWIGDEGTIVESASVPSLFAVLLVSAVVFLTQLTGNQLFPAKDKLKWLALLIGTEAVLNLGLSIILLQRYGLMGVALGTLIPAVIMRGLVQPVVVGRLIDLPLRGFFRTVWMRLLALLLVLGALVQTVPRFEATSWPQLAVGGLISFAVVGILAAALCLDKSDREELIERPLRFLSSLVGAERH